MPAHYAASGQLIRDCSKSITSTPYQKEGKQSSTICSSCVGHVTCCYTPRDIALYLRYADFSHSAELAVIRDLCSSQRAFLQEEYRDNRPLLRRHIDSELAKLDEDGKDLRELIILLQGTEYAIDTDEVDHKEDAIESFFKIVRLSLIYGQENGYRKIKLRRLLKHFGYKRRSAQWVARVQCALDDLDLKTYLKGNIPCDISEIDIDNMVMIRLK